MMPFSKKKKKYQYTSISQYCKICKNNRNLFLYQIGVEFSGKSNEIGFNAVSLVSFKQNRHKFLQLNIFATVGEFIRAK